MYSKFIFIAFLSFPLSMYAWTSNSTNKQIIKEFSEYIQPESSAKYDNKSGVLIFLESKIVQGNMSAVYTRDEKNLTDKITLKIWNKTRILSGPWSRKTKKDRHEGIQVKARNDWMTWYNGFYDYELLKLSPSGNYLEMIVGRYEGWSWLMLDTRTGKIVLEWNIIKSMWSADRKRFIFQTCVPEEITKPSTCKTQLKVFLTKESEFPKYTQIQ